MSSSSEGRARMASLIPEALRAVLTPVQQFLLMDTVLVVSVGDLRRALCDAEFAEQLVQRREEPAPVRQQRAFTPRPASEAELAAAEQRAMIAADEAARRAVTEAAQFAVQQQRVARERELVQVDLRQQHAEAEAAERRRMAEAAAAAVERRRAAAAEAAERRRAATAEAERRRQEAARQSAASRRRAPNRQQPNSGSPQPFADAIRNIAQSTGHQPGRVPVLGGQSGAREESLAQARASRVPVDWNSETMWKRSREPRTTPAVRISAMAADNLLSEVENTVTNVTRVFQLYAANDDVWTVRNDQSALVQAKRWLAVQPAFRALVQEAVRRGVEFNTSTLSYITEFVLGASSNAQLADFVNHPVRVVTEESVVDTFGRSGRALRLDDD